MDPRQFHQWSPPTAAGTKISAGIIISKANKKEGKNGNSKKEEPKKDSNWVYVHSHPRTGELTLGTHKVAHSWVMHKDVYAAKAGKKAKPAEEKKASPSPFGSSDAGFATEKKETKPPKKAKPAATKPKIKPIEAKPATEKKAAPKVEKPKAPKTKPKIKPIEAKPATEKKAAPKVEKPKAPKVEKIKPTAEKPKVPKVEKIKPTAEKPKVPKVEKIKPITSKKPERLPGQGAGVMTGTTGGPQLTGETYTSTGGAKKALAALESTVSKAGFQMTETSGGPQLTGKTAPTTKPSAPKTAIKPVGADTPAASVAAGPKPVVSGAPSTEGVKLTGSTGGPQLTGRSLPSTGGSKGTSAPAKQETKDSGSSGKSDKPAPAPAKQEGKPKKDPGEFVSSGYATGAAVGRYIGAETGGSTTGGTALPQAATGLAGQAALGRGATVRGTSLEQAKTPTRAATVSRRQSPGRVGETPGRPTPTQAAMKSFQNVPQGIPGVRTRVGR